MRGFDVTGQTLEDVQKLTRLVQAFGGTSLGAQALGVTGTVYVDALSTLKALGLSSSSIDNVVRSWIRMSMNHTHSLLTRRRELDGHYIKAAFVRPP